MKNIYDSWSELQKQTLKDTKTQPWFSLVSAHNKTWENQDYPLGEDWKYVRFGELSSSFLSLPKNSSSNKQFQDSQFFTIEINDFSYPTRLKKTPCPEGLEVKTHMEEFDFYKKSPVFKLFNQSSNNPFAQSALSFTGLGLVLRLKPKIILKKPVKIILNLKSIKEVSSLNVFNLFIESHQFSRGQIFIDFQGQTLNGLSNFRLDINMNENSHLELFSKEKGGSKSYFVYNLQAHLEQGARLKTFDFTFPGQWTRHNLQVNLKDTESEINMKGIYVNNKNYFSDHHTHINHWVEKTISSENYRGVLSDQAQGVFNGRVYIAPDAGKSHSEQINKNLMLSKQAEINTKPELQIYNDNVKATHGATVGQLDKEQSFYLQSRGYTYQEALKTLSKAFVFDLINEESSHVKNFYLSDLDHAIFDFGES